MLSVVAFKSAKDARVKCIVSYFAQNLTKRYITKNATEVSFNPSVALFFNLGLLLPPAQQCAKQGEQHEQEATVNQP